MVEINNLTDYELNTKDLKGFIGGIIEQESLEGDLSVAFLKKEEIAEINESYRNHEGPTDVLSFEDEEDLGEILICPAVVEKEKEKGGSFEKHLKRVLAHGLLHLAGYDHKTDEDKRHMLSKQEEFLC